jgi:glutamine synthetase
MYKTCSFPELVQGFNITNELGMTDVFTFNIIADVEIELKLDSFRYMSWLGEGNILVFGEFLQHNDSEHSLFYPRNVLKKVIHNVEKKHGVTFKAASEIEFYLNDQKTDSIIKNYPKINIEENKFTNLCSSFWLSNQTNKLEKYTKVMRDNIKNSGIELEYLCFWYKFWLIYL